MNKLRDVHSKKDPMCPYIITMDESGSDEELLVPEAVPDRDGPREDPQTAVYRRRWYILAVFSLISTTQGFIWGSWGPIANSTNHAFGWEDRDIALLALWGPICFLPAAPFFSWLQNAKGLRWATIVAGVLVTAGAGIRCVSSSPPLVTWLANVSQVLNALAGPMALGAFANLSATWFPASQRTTSTAILAVVKGLGYRLSFVIGPLLVPDVTNSTGVHHNVTGNHTTPTVKAVRKDILLLMYITFGWTAMLFLCILVYFPAKPPLPPSLTAAEVKPKFLTSLKALVRKRKFWIVALAYVIPYGGQIGYSSVLDVNLDKIGVSQTTAGWIGFTAGIVANLSGLAIGTFSDIFNRRMKRFILASYSLGAVFFTVFLLLYMGVIPQSDALLWTSLILGVTGALAPNALFLELSCEVAWPVPEDVNNGFLTMILNFPTMLPPLIVFIPQMGTTWLNWLPVASFVIAIPAMLCFREEYSRLDRDIPQQ